MILLLLFTVFMGYMARDVKMAFNFNTAVPETDENYKYFQDFKKNFGEDGNILVLGMKDSSLYELENFNKYEALNKKLQKVEGITNVISLATLQNITKNQDNRSFELSPLVGKSPTSQAELDSLMAVALNLKFYSGQLMNVKNGATLILITMDREVLNSKLRNDVVGEQQWFFH